MATPANLTYTQIEERVMNNLRIPVSNAAERVKVQAVINEVYRDICAKQDWWWLKKEVIINTTPKIETGTVSLTQNSTSVTFTDIPVFQNPDGTTGAQVDITNWMLSIPGAASDPLALYRLTNYTLGSVTATLEGAYTGVTDTAAGYRLYQDAYSLPVDCGKILSFQRFGEVLPAQRVGIEQMLQVKQYDRREGRPEMYSVYDFFGTGDPMTRRQLQIHPFPDKMYRMQLWYKQSLNTELANQVQPFIPDDYRQVLVYGSLSRCYAIFLNDLDRSSYFLNMFNDVMALMSAQQKEYADDKSQITPDMTMYRRRSRRPRTAYTLGSWFDTIPSYPP